MKKMLLIILLIPFLLYSQIRSDLVTDMKMISIRYNWDNSYLRHTEDIITNDVFTDSTVFLKYNIEFGLSAQNSAIDLQSNYNDRLHMFLGPSIYGRATKNVSFYIRGLIQNAKTDVVDSRKRYYGDEQGGVWGDFEVSKIMYDSKHFNFKFGRDYFMPGMDFHESILFSNEQSTYDQIYLSYKNDWMNLSSYALRLDNINDNYRYINGHRLSFDLFKMGYFSIGELLLYYGENRPLNLYALNPFLVYYLYQRNFNLGQTNSIIFSELFFHFHDYFIYSEIMLDDFQIDKSTYGDLEPTEYGINITTGKKNIFKGFNATINYTMISNRTYSAPHKEEYFIYKNLPVGHFMGSNFWEIKSSLSYIKEKYQGEVQFVYRVSGDDVLYSDFNFDYLQGHDFGDLLPEGSDYQEEFPYVSSEGDPTIFYGFKTDQYYHLLNWLGLNLKASYWFNKGELSNQFNIVGGFYILF